MTESEIAERVRSFLSERVRGAAEVSGDDNLFELGLVNSLFAMQLVNFVENEFGCVVEDDDLSIENFQSVNAITGLIARKSGSVALKLAQ
jgi:acyl carrier protein